MKIKAACIGCPDSVVTALSSSQFATEVLTNVVGGCLNVKDVLERPAEYYVQTADVGPAPKKGVMGVEVRLTGVSREGRTPEQFEGAKNALQAVVASTIRESLDYTKECQVFCAIMIDNEVESPPNSGKYTNVVESKPIWVEGVNQ